ncbi:hypothetical protein [Dokdonella soli]|uniref:hypothetical protein n=1 Tax=Dokdonella soli TaxID=529810 RepID=UPI0031E185F2
MSVFAQGATAAASPAARKPGHVLVFAGAGAPTLIDRLKAEGFASTAPESLQDAHAIAGIASGGPGSVAVIGAGAGVSAALQFARSSTSVKTVIVFGDDQGSALAEFTTLHAKRSYSVLVLDAADHADWTGAKRWLDRHLV